MNIVRILQFLGSIVIGFCAALQISYYLNLRRKIWFSVTVGLFSLLVFCYRFLPESLRLLYLICSFLLSWAAVAAAYTEAFWHKLYSTLIQGLVTCAILYGTRCVAEGLQLSTLWDAILRFAMISVLHGIWCVCMYFARLRVFTVLPEPEANYKKTAILSMIALIPLFICILRDLPLHLSEISARLLLGLATIWITALEAICILHFCVMSNSEMVEEERLMTLDAHNRYLKQYVDDVMSHQREIHILEHDQRHTLSAVKALLQAGENEKAEEYLTSLLSRFEKSAVVTYCDNGIVNAILQDIASRAANAGISFSVQVSLEEKIFISDVDLVPLLENILENAVECCARQLKQEEHFIRVSILTHGGFFRFRCENSVDEAPLIRNGRMISRKNDGLRHGLGMESIQMIVKKYSGIVDYSSDGTTFVLSAVMDNGGA